MSDGTTSSAAVATLPDPRVRRPRRIAAAILLTGMLALVVVFPLFTAIVLGEEPYALLHVGYPGVDVTIITTVLLAGAQLGTLLASGVLVHLLFLRGAPVRKARMVPEGFEISLLRGASGLWATCAGGLIFFEALDSNGTPFDRLAAPNALAYLWEASYAPQAWTISFFAAMIVLFASFFAERWTGLLIPLWATAIAVLAPVVSGQVLVGPDHDFGSDAAFFQTIAVNAFFGSVLVATLRVVSGRLTSPVTLRRLFVLGAVSIPIIVVTDVIIAVFTLAGSSVTSSLTGWLLIGGAASLALISAVLVLAAILAGRGRLRVENLTGSLVVASLGVLGWTGFSLAATRQPPPQYFVPTSIEQIFMGFEVPDPPSLAVLFGQWRPNLLFLGIAAAAIAVYLVAVRTLRRRGDTWPVGRTIAWIAGWGVVVVATSSGFGKYSAPDFGVHMIVHMSLNMLAPGLLVLGGIVTLLLRASRSDRNKPASLHDWITWVLHWRVLQFLYNPLIVFVIFIGSYYGLYLTGMFEELMRFHWAHQLMNLHFLIVGYLYYSLIIGVDRPPRPLPHIGKLGYVLAAMPFHAFFGVILMTSPGLIAENFYRYLNVPWADLQAQQYLAGGVAWAGGEIPLMIVILALGIQWSRQDAREASRKDRHLDTGRDDEYDAYNDMLQRLTDRDATRPSPQPSDREEIHPR